MHIGSCRYADSPTEDMEWLRKGCTELACERDLPGAADSHADACCAGIEDVFSPQALKVASIATSSKGSGKARVEASRG